MSDSTSSGPQGPRMFQILGNTNIDFLSRRRIALVVSIVLVAMGLIATFQIFVTGNANLGIEFTGGTSVTLDFEEDVSIQQARQALADEGFPNAQVTHAEGEGGYSLIVQLKQESVSDLEVGEAADEVMGILADAFPDNAITDSSNTSIGPAIGSELRQKAIWAIIYAILGIIIYVGFRFDPKFGVAATVAMFHDVLAVMGVMWLKNFIVPTEFTLLIMTAVLTLAGYSLTDTVVVFDRIRENLRKERRSGLVYLVNHSINQVLSRTVVTSTTTLLVVLSILFFGGSVLYNFALALTAGILIGTYSSIFVASPLLVLWASRGGGTLIGRSVTATGSDSQAAEQQAPSS